MMEFLADLDRRLLLYLNHLNTPLLDEIMFLVSDKLIWIPLYAVLVYFVIKKFGNESWAPLLAIAIMIIVSDQTNTAILKPLFQRLRPSREPAIAGMVHIVKNYKGGLYGFASSHASNTFATAIFFFSVFRKTHPWMILLFAWAAIVSYSRIYLGLHYPGDVLGGLVVGCLSAVAGLKINDWLSGFNLRKKKSPVQPE